MGSASHENSEPSSELESDGYGARKKVVRCTIQVSVGFAIVWALSLAARNWLHPFPLSPTESLPEIAAYGFLLGISSAGIMLLPRRVGAAIIWSLLPLVVTGMLVVVGLLHTAWFGGEEAWFVWFTWLMPVLRFLHGVMLVFLALLVALAAYGWIAYFVRIRSS